VIKIDEIAAVPAAPPSKLSKKFIELLIPTTQKTVNKISKKVEPVGFAILLFIINTIEIKIPDIVCAINLRSGDKFFMSSHNPTMPIAIAGPRTEVANQKLLKVEFEKNKAEYDTVTTPISIAKPPRYGIALVCDL
jgi:hypothetical protein